MIAPLFIGVAWAIEALVGWPDWLYRRIRHPVVWIGALVAWLERHLNRATDSDAVRYSAGVATSVVTLFLTTAAALATSRLLPNTVWGYLVEALIASSLIASRSLYSHVSAVLAPLTTGKVDAARAAVSKIVGRDPNVLDEAGLTRASLESLAENASDGVIAPVFWGAMFGLPGIAFYKAVGGFAARLDDGLNLIPARLTGLFISTASGDRIAFQIMWRDAGRHRSPNAGWPEAAMAGALGVRLSGPRVYGAHSHDEPWLNPEGREPGAADLKRGLDLYRRALALAGLVLLSVAGGVLYAT